MTETIIASLLQVVIGLATPILLLLFYKAINLVELKLKIQLTDQQRTIIQGAVDTGAGLIESSIRKGQLKAEEIDTNNPKMRAITDTAMKNVQESANSLNVTPNMAANMIIARHARSTT